MVARISPSPGDRVDCPPGRATRREVILQPGPAALTDGLDQLVAWLAPPWLGDRVEGPVEGGTTPALVLIVDDDESIRLVLSHIVELAGYRVVTAASAADALKALTEPPAVALLDYAMPEVDGVELGTRLRALYPDVRVIIQSGSTLDPIIAAQESGLIHAHLQKPWKNADVREAIASQLRADEDGQVVSGKN